MQASCIKQHSGTTVHKTSVRSYLAPDQPVVEFLQQQPGDEGLLAGNVPQPEDWLRAWRACRTPSSFNALAEMLVTEHYIRQVRTVPVARRAIKQMLAVMSEVTRSKKREVLRSAWSISLSLDDRKDYRLIRFRCHDDKGAVSGILAVLRGGGRASIGTLQDLDEDKSKAVAESVVHAIKQLCAPAGGTLDQALEEHILQHIRHYVSDGGASVQRAGHILATSVMPNLVLVSRDPSHTVRIAVRDPLHAVPRFEKQWEMLFNGRHALVPDIMNSEVWRSRLVACQRQVLRTERSQGGGLETVLRHMSFAKQRFDSHAEPLRKFCCLIRAIAMLLAQVAADPRNDFGMRQRADNILQSMTPSELFTAGITADYAAETLDFVRRFDVDDHDPAVTPREVRHFIRRMRLLFSEAHILTTSRSPDGPSASSGASASSGPAAASASSSSGPPAGQCLTITQIVLQQCQDPEPIMYGDRVLVLWSAASPKQVSGL